MKWANFNLPSLLFFVSIDPLMIDCYYSQYAKPLHHTPHKQQQQAVEGGLLGGGCFYCLSIEGCLSNPAFPSAETVTSQPHTVDINSGCSHRNGGKRKEKEEGNARAAAATAAAAAAAAIGGVGWWCAAAHHRAAHRAAATCKRLFAAGPT